MYNPRQYTFDIIYTGPEDIDQSIILLYNTDHDSTEIMITDTSPQYTELHTTCQHTDGLQRFLEKTGDYIFNMYITGKHITEQLAPSIRDLIVEITRSKFLHEPKTQFVSRDDLNET